MAIVKDLLALCVGLSQRAASVIRDVQKEREAGVDLKAELKDASDPRTYLTCADQRAQKVIVDVLKATYPTLKLVGEEDDDEGALQDWKAPDFAPLNPKACDELLSGDALQQYESVTLDEITVFVDPVDGTREFVQGRLDACQVLIGIALSGRPIAGVITLPFHNTVGTTPTPYSSAKGCTIFGVVGVGVSGLPERRNNDKLVVATSAGCTNKTLAAVREVINAEELHVGACGNKALRVLLGETDVALFNLASSLWDTCATQAVVTAQGGKVTTLHGNAIEHLETGTRANRFGVIVTSSRYTQLSGMTHEQLCSKLKNLPPVASLLHVLGVSQTEEQAVDIMRDITGHYYTADDFSEMLCGKKGVVTSYSAREEEAVRYKQSYACRIRFESDGTAPASVFYKRVVLRDMPYAVNKAQKFPFKLVRDVASCKVEANFLASECPVLYSKTSGASIALAKKVDQRLCDHRPIDSMFGLILQDFCKEDGWGQFPKGHDLRQLTSQLKSLAYFHAFFWLGERHDGCGDEHHDVKAKLLEKVWKTGTYWDMAKQPKTQLENLKGAWEKILERFEGVFRKEDMDASLGTRLAAVAEAINTLTHGVDKEGNPDAGENFTKYKTVIHGDTKAANFLFKETGEDIPAIGVIDFQWTGVGLPGTDVAYCIAASASPDVLFPLDGPSDRRLAEIYHGYLMEAFVKYNVAPAITDAEKLFPLITFMSQYQTALLDLGRTVVCDHWSTMTPEILRSREDSSTAFNAYNKNLKVAVWLASRLNIYLNEWKN
eukprot:TRINITY_DN22989_c0_g1_i1.p1 TRINITY_DN22989_c0_g1~~TRINITY_DN22989_c0_g1_i1.p1  ORF type:complete len:802 (+),score=209.56 TRINITY_DN22989_c0_g1_i1:80-2407(+)